MRSIPSSFIDNAHSISCARLKHGNRVRSLGVVAVDLEIVEMMVYMDCHGCGKKVRRALENLDDDDDDSSSSSPPPPPPPPSSSSSSSSLCVDDIEIDMDLQKVTVTGYVEHEKVLKVVRKTGRRAELWLFPYYSQCFAFTKQYADLYTYHNHSVTYFQAEQPDTIYSHIYHVHGYNDHDHHTHQELPYTIVHGETTFVAFSDENVNACSIM
ncbi:hypothetical protein L2E82_14920 [Cichorium intybus]|uniref:Uncharacterized protein n=1 Tax=Cichorium intybus TaxID=13427 RepID=A0ACB9F0Q6_CICIN|nr:hypothetical protein L2E82_14920 [Cichorium intybus]